MSQETPRRTRERVAQNLYIVTTKAGTRLYVVRWMADGKAREKSLGPVSLISLRQAKSQAQIVIAADAEERAAGERVPLFAEVARDAMGDIERAKRWRNPRSSQQWRSSIEHDALPGLGKLRIDAITRDDVLKVLRPIWDTKAESARRLQQRLSAVFDWAIMKGLRRDNPAQWRSNLAFSLPPKSKVAPVQHHDAPSIEELRKVVAYCRSHPGAVSGCILLTIGTVCRISEARQAAAEQIEGDVWTVPGDAQKVDRGARRVPLSPIALEGVAMGKKSGILFTGLKGGVLALDSPRLKLQAIIGRKTTIHGVRSTFRDWAPSAGIDRDIAERCLSHEVGTDTERAYLRQDFLEDRRRALELWSAVFCL